MQHLPSLSEEIQKLVAEASSQAADTEAQIQELRDSLAAKEQEALGKYEMLLQEIQKAFHESENHFEQWKKTESLLPPLVLECGKIELGHQRADGPHLSWDFTLLQASLLGRRWAHLDLRLVEHHGHAGLLIFEAKGASPPLHCWNPNGEEGGHPFMLLVPHDHSTQALLSSLPASDLVFLRDAVSKFLQQISILEPIKTRSLFWIQVARRLLQHLHEIPNRIYYDSVKTAFLPDSHGQPTLRFELVNAYHAGQLFDSLPVQWDVSASRIHIESTIGKSSPLLAWPNTETGQPAQEIVFDLANDSPGSPARRQWSKWLKHDQQLVSFLIREFPNFLHHFFEQHPDSPIPKAPLQKEARKLRYKLRRATDGKRPDILLQRLFNK
jgi:hypothetical protein